MSTHDFARNCLSYWFPKIKAAGLPVPETTIIRTDLNLLLCLDGKPVAGWGSFVSELREAAERIGYPVFLRTGQGSGKHCWRDTCFVPDAASVSSHVAELVEWSNCVDLMGLPTNVWVVREMLPTKPIVVLPAYKDMPLCREFRVFVKDGEVSCCHPYWPWKAIVRGFPRLPGGEPFSEGERDVPPDLPDKVAKMSSLGADDADVRSLASRAGRAVGGEWSVDVLETTRGWYVTDMALAARSWHWPGCRSHAQRENME